MRYQFECPDDDELSAAFLYLAREVSRRVPAFRVFDAIAPVPAVTPGLDRYSPLCVSVDERSVPIDETEIQALSWLGFWTRYYRGAKPEGEIVDAFKASAESLRRKESGKFRVPGAAKRSEFEIPVLWRRPLVNWGGTLGSRASGVGCIKQVLATYHRGGAERVQKTIVAAHKRGKFGSDLNGGEWKLAETNVIAGRLFA